MRGSPFRSANQFGKAVRECDAEIAAEVEKGAKNENRFLRNRHRKPGAARVDHRGGDQRRTSQFRDRLGTRTRGFPRTLFLALSILTRRKYPDSDRHSTA